MSGLFGGARRALGNFARTDDQGRTFGDKLAIIGATMQDVSDPDRGALQRQMAGLARRQHAQAQQQATARLNGSLFGGAGQNAQQPLDLESLSQGNLGPTDTEAAQRAPAGGGLPSLRSAAPALIQAMQAGVDISDYVSILDKAKPNLTVGPDGTAFDSNDSGNIDRRFANRTNINGFVTDLNNPKNENRYLPQLGEGQRPLYDEQGNIAGVANLDGSVQAIAQREGAVAASREASANPYRLDTVMGPDGRTITTSRANILGGDPIRGQSASEQAYAVDSAKNQAAQEDKREERASAAVRMLPTLDRMEELLPDIIAGQGADWRRAGARFAGTFMGNEEAARRAASTEVFQNEARQVVSQIIGTFGANPTEGERKYAEQMAGADVNLTPQALQEGIRLARLRAQRDIGAQNGGQSGDRAARAREILRQRGRIQ